MIQPYMHTVCSIVSYNAGNPETAPSRVNADNAIVIKPTAAPSTWPQCHKAASKYIAFRGVDPWSTEVESAAETILLVRLGLPR